MLDVNVAGTQPYVVSEYIPGPSLAEVIYSDGLRTGGALDRIAINTATALGAIHHAGVVHRDFKAANVLLGPDGPVVIDFGVAKALGAVERQATLTGQQAGTPACMAPEQFRDHPAGPETDIFAWGATMVFAATGALPFRDGSIPSVIHRILNEAPDLGGLHGPMRDLVAECLAKDPAARPTARQIVDRLMSAGNVPDRPDRRPASRQLDARCPSSPGDDNRTPAQGSHAAGLLSPAAPPQLPAGRRGPREKLRVRRAALIAADVVIVPAGGIVVGLEAFASPGAHHTATGGGPPPESSPSPERTDPR